MGRQIVCEHDDARGFNLHIHLRNRRGVVAHSRAHAATRRRTPYRGPACSGSRCGFQSLCCIPGDTSKNQRALAPGGDGPTIGIFGHLSFAIFTAPLGTCLLLEYLNRGVSRDKLFTLLLLSFAIVAVSGFWETYWADVIADDSDDGATLQSSTWYNSPMTVSFEPTRRYTVEEYLELEGKTPEEKFEYRDGIVVAMREALAMAGGSLQHVAINTNLVTALGNRLKGGPCRAYGNDLRVRIPRKTLYTYPDMSVVCGEAQTEKHGSAGETLLNPRLIVEVLSPSTERYDRGDKFAMYREIPSFVEYVLVSQTHPRIETFFHHEDGGWSFGPYEGLHAVAKLLSIGVELPLAEVYEGIEFPPSSGKRSRSHDH